MTDLFSYAEPDLPARTADPYPGEPSYVYDTGATFFEVHQAIIALTSTSEMYPYKERPIGLLLEETWQYADIRIPRGPQAAELHKLWNELATEHKADCARNGANSIYDEPTPEPPGGGVGDVDGVNDALCRMQAKKNRLLLPKDVQFSKRCYANIKELLARAGGKYSKNGFTFKPDVDAQDIKRRLLDGEELNDKKKFQFYATPKFVAHCVQQAANCMPEDLVLEPSAGHGALLEYIGADVIHCCELNEDNRAVLTEKGYELVGTDFLEYSPGPIYDRVVANPPFTKNQDIKHVRHMYDCTKPGGRVVSIMPTGWMSGDISIRKTFRQWLKKIPHDIQKLEKGAFKESGTQVETCILTIEKPF